MVFIAVVGSPAGQQAMSSASIGLGNLITGIGNGIKHIVDSIPLPKPLPADKVTGGNAAGKTIPSQPKAPTLDWPEPCLPLRPSGWNNLLFIILFHKLQEKILNQLI